MKNKLTTLMHKIKNKLNKWDWRRIGAIFVLFLVIGMSFAIYQYYNTAPSSDSPAPSTDDPQLNVTTKSKNYNLHDSQLKLSNKQHSKPTQQQDQEKPQSSIKVNSDVPRANFENLARPVQGEIISVCEWYRDQTLDAWKYNPGMDFSAEIGTAVKAVQAGEVIEINKDDYRGITITITHNEKYKTKYANLRKAKIKENTRITRGQIIGEVGDSGSNQKNKLHFEIIKQGKTISPAKYFN